MVGVWCDRRRRLPWGEDGNMWCLSWKESSGNTVIVVTHGRGCSTVGGSGAVPICRFVQGAWVELLNVSVVIEDLTTLYRGGRGHRGEVESGILTVLYRDRNMG